MSTCEQEYKLKPEHRHSTHSLSLIYARHTESIHNKLKVKRSSNYLCIESEISFSYFTYFCHDCIQVSSWYPENWLNWIHLVFCAKNYFQKKKINQQTAFNKSAFKQTEQKNKFGWKLIWCFFFCVDRNILFVSAFGPIWKAFFSINRPRLTFYDDDSLTIFAPYLGFFPGWLKSRA